MVKVLLFRVLPGEILHSVRVWISCVEKVKYSELGIYFSLDMNKKKKKKDTLQFAFRCMSEHTCSRSIQIKRKMSS